MHSSTLVLLLSLWLVVTCHAYSAFKTECSIPSTSVNFVSSPDTRGTLDIVFSCLFTIIACTWSVQHLSVPEQWVVKRAVDKGPANEAREEGQADQTANESRRDRAKANGFWADFRWNLKGFWTNLKWMLFTVVAPEIIFGKALSDFVSARLVRERMKVLADFDNVEWGLEHSFYANIGGFVGVEQNNDDQVQGTPLAAHQIYLLRITVAESNKKLQVSEITAGREQFKTCIEKLPNITAAEINDKSKGNVFVKAVTLLQVSSVILQICVRAGKGLSISLLELSVVAFSACSIVTYLLLLYKPQGVRIPTRIRYEPGGRNLIDSTLLEYSTPIRILFTPGSHAKDIDDWKRVRRRKIPNDFIHGEFDMLGEPDRAKSLVAAMFWVMLGGVIFGSIHVAGWNLTFPTQIERTLWRISSIFITVFLPITCLPSIFLLERLPYYVEFVFCNEGPRAVPAWSFLLGIIYFLARLFMSIEIIRALFYLPPDSYISTWTSNIPHLS